MLLWVGGGESDGHILYQRKWGQIKPAGTRRRVLVYHVTTMRSLAVGFIDPCIFILLIMIWKQVRF